MQEGDDWGEVPYTYILIYGERYKLPSEVDEKPSSDETLNWGQVIPLRLSISQDKNLPVSTNTTPLTSQTVETTVKRCYCSFLGTIHLPIQLTVQITGLVLS